MPRVSSLGLAAFLALAAAAPSRAEPTPRVPSRDETFNLLDTENFASLEKISTALRAARTGFYNGWPLIYDFYGNLAFDTPDDKVWSRYIGLLKKWQAAYPESPTPRIALASLYKDYAWQARGSGYANTVTAEGSRLFEERLKAAQAILEEVTAMKVQDAEAYYMLLIVAKGLGLPRGQMEDAFNRGVGIDPDFTPLYAAKAEYLLPRWYGAEGDWETFAKEAADRRGGKDGDILYLFIVRTEAYTGGDDLFKDSRLSYERMKRGFLESRLRYPRNNYDLNSYCYFASIAGDKPTAAGLFSEIGENYNEETWGSRENFAKWRKWANDGEIAAVLDLNPAGLFALKLAAGALLLFLIGLTIYFVKPKSAPPSTPTLQ